MAPPQSKDLKDLLKTAQAQEKRTAAPKASAERAKAISSLSGFITKNEDKLYGKEFDDVKRSIKSLLEKSKQEKLRSAGQTETIKEVESSVAKMMDKMGSLFQSVNNQLVKSTSSFYNLSKDTMREYRDAIRQDISINKTNVVAMALAQSTPIFGYFVGKFMETSLFKRMGDTIKEKFSSALGWVADRFKGMFGKTRNWFEKRAEAKSGTRESRKAGKLPAKPTFPHMQTGGYVTKGGIVQVHEAEIVTPVEKFFKYMEQKTGKKDLLDRIEYWVKEMSFGVIDLEKFIKRERTEQRGFIETFFKNWMEERHFEEKDWRERVVRTLAELKTGLFGMTSAIRIAWQRTLMEHPTFRYMIGAAEVMRVTFVKPVKWLFGIRGGYRSMLPKGNNVLENISSILGLIFTNMMPKLDQMTLTLKDLYETLTKEKAKDYKEETYTMMEKIKNFFTGKTTFKSPFESLVDRLDLSKDALKEAGVTKIRHLFSPSRLLKAVGITSENVMDLYRRMGEAKEKGETIKSSGGGILKRPFAWMKEKKAEATIQAKELWKNVYSKIYGKLSVVAENTKKPSWYKKIMGWVAQFGLFLLNKITGFFGLFSGGAKGLWNLLRGALGLGAGVGIGKGLISIVKGALGKIFVGGKGLVSSIGKALGLGWEGVKGAGRAVGRGGRAVGRGVRTAGRFLGRAAGGIGAGVMGAADAYAGYQKAKEWGVSGAAAAIGGALGGTEGGWEGAKEGALKGAGLGATIGSFIMPGIGTAIGAGVGAIAGAMLGYVGGKNIAKGIDAVWAGVKDLVDAAWKWLKHPIELMVGAYKKMSTWIGDKLYEIVEGAKDTFRNIGDNLWKGVTAIGEGLSDTFNWIFDIAGKIKDWLIEKITRIPGVKQIISAAKVVKEKVVEGAQVVGAGAASAAKVVTGEVSKTAESIAGKVGALFNINRKVNMEGLKDPVKSSFQEMGKEYKEKTGSSIGVNSAFRTSAEQAELYRTLPKGQAAPPGRSAHEKGLAIDVNSVDANRLAEMGLLEKYGFARPVSKEAWHLQYAGGIGDAHSKDFYSKPFFTGKSLAETSSSEAVMSLMANANLARQIGDGFGEITKSSQNMQSAMVNSNNVVTNSVRAMSSNAGQQSSGGSFDLEIQGLLSGNLP